VKKKTSQPYRRVPMIGNTNVTVLRQAVAYITNGKVSLTPRGKRELEALKEQYGSKPCRYCRFWDGRCVLNEPEVCK